MQTCRRMVWENKTKQRYYAISLEKDLLGDWCLIKCWGRCNTRLGRSQCVAYATLIEAQQALLAVQRRRALRGYQLKYFLVSNTRVINTLQRK